MAKAAVETSGGDTRDRIVEAALETFTEMGFDGASTREIANRVGVNHGLIPYYFGTKEKLWQVAVARAFEDLETGVAAILADLSIGTDRERAIRLVREHVEFVAARPEFVRLMFEEGKRRGPRMRWIVDHHVKPLYEGVAALHGRVASAPFRDVEPAHFFYVFAGATGLIFHQAEECKRLSGVDPFDPDVVDAHARAVASLLFGPDPTSD